MMEATATENGAATTTDPLTKQHPAYESCRNSITSSLQHRQLH